MRTKNWTHHHTRRGYHLLTFSTSALTVVFLAWALGTSLAISIFHPGLNKDEFKGRVENAVTEEPSQATPKSEIVGEPKITVVPGESIQQRYVLRDEEVQPIFIFPTQYPKFIGQTNVTGGTVMLDAFGPIHVTGKTRVDSNGNWAWEPAVPIKPGAYMLNVKALDRSASAPGDKALAQDSLLFEVVLDKGQKVATIDINNTPNLGNNGNLFDVRAVIAESTKEIEASQEIQADIKFVNIGSPSKPIDVEVKYTIRNSKDEIISESSETVAVYSELLYSKSFATAEALPAGIYTLTVAIPSEDLVATATDTFEIIDKEAEAALAAKNSIFSNRTLMIEILVGIVFVGILVAYMEYNKVVILTRRIRQLNEKDILKKAHA